MHTEEIYSRLNDVFASVFDDPVSVHPNLTAKDVEEWDSLTHITLIIAVERAFSIKFSTGEIADFENVAAMVRRIAALTEGA